MESLLNKMKRGCLWILLLLTIIQTGHTQRIVGEREELLRRENGSNPKVSLLTDGIIPVLSDFENENWARQLYTTSNSNRDQELPVTIDFSNLVQQVNLEVVLFNCPEWNIGTDRIRISGGDSEREQRSVPLGEITDLPTSCDSLVHVCLPAISTVLAPFVALDFSNLGRNSYIHLAEVIFNSGSCPANLVTRNQNTAGGSGITTFGFDEVNGSISNPSISINSIIPTLSNLEGDMWARELTTLLSPNDTTTAITITLDNINDGLAFDNVELVIFNCPEWEIGLGTISIFGGNTPLGVFDDEFPTSCERLIHVCLPLSMPVVNIDRLQITRVPDFSSSLRWLHLAEVIRNNRTDCPGNLLAPTLGRPEEEETFSLTILVVAAVCSGIGACLIVSVTCLLICLIFFKRNTLKSKQELPVAVSNADKKLSAGQEAPGQAQEIQLTTVTSGSSIATRGLPATPSSAPLNKRPPEPVPRTSVVSMGQQIAPSPMSERKMTPVQTSSRRNSDSATKLTAATSANGSYNVAGHGHNKGAANGSLTDTYMKVVDGNMEGGREKGEEFYEDVDGNRKEGEEFYEDMDEHRKEGVELYEDMTGSRKEGEEEEEMYVAMDAEDGTYLTPDEVNSNFNVDSNGAYILRSP